ncbi:Transposase and inactivated derivatives [hydrothermal vent metagenome]|uniref:Transposase and inactivated derivatives n=1 Tax=hydrothermal vent metagenome TaxID=652676 RepID=A0A3B0Z7Q5_9ZZZZ
MTEYRRAAVEGGTYFFTVNCAERHNNTLLTDNVELLKEVIRKVKNAHPFEIDAMVVLPEHLHCIWTLPVGDSNVGVRWSLIKSGFSRAIPRGERRSKSRIDRGERGLWQRRFWEHVVRDEKEFAHYVDYIHWNPVKHGWVKRVVDWPHSSFHRYVERGVYPVDWGGHLAFDAELGE